LVNPKSGYARDIIIASFDSLEHRSKLIKISDSSDGSWDAARQYVANPIASDSSDEFKIIRAENREIHKAKVQE